MYLYNNVHVTTTTVPIPHLRVRNQSHDRGGNTNCETKKQTNNTSMSHKHVTSWTLYKADKSGSVLSSSNWHWHWTPGNTQDNIWQKSSQIQTHCLFVCYWRETHNNWFSRCFVESKILIDCFHPDFDFTPLPHPAPLPLCCWRVRHASPTEACSWYITLIKKHFHFFTFSRCKLTYFLCTCIAVRWNHRRHWLEPNLCVIQISPRGVWGLLLGFPV